MRISSRAWARPCLMALAVSAGMALVPAPIFAAPAAPPPRSPQAPAALPGGAPPAAAPKKIEGPTTTDASTLHLARNLLTVRLEKGFYEIMELLDFENKGKATIVSKDGAPTLRIVLPRSSNVRNPNATIEAAPHGMEQEFLRTMGAEILSTEPIPPGRKMVVLLYRLADEYGGITVEKPVAYGTENFVLLPEKDRVQASAQGLARQEAVSFQDRTYDRFTGSTRTGTSVRFHVQAPASGGGLGIFYAAGGGILVLGGLFSLWVRSRRSRALSLRVEREGLLRQIAALDDRLAQGEISAGDHRRERGPRFARLRELSGG